MGQESQPRLEAYGSMHETIGQQQHQGRIGLADLLENPDLCGVGALERLRGEISIVDGTLVVTAVDSDGKLKSFNDQARSLQATLFVGGSVKKWQVVPLGEAVGPNDFDKLIGEQATALGIDPSRPFLFLIEGKFTVVRLHVINGACPLHARLRNKPIEEGQKPFEREFERVSGKLVGVFARDAVGKLTHPATSVHAHLVFEDQDGQVLTGHLERVGVARDATLRLPMGERKKP